ncbi:MAG: hypothetical protein AAB262_13440, partial [Elusimicrobiota bacterium]
MATAVAGSSSQGDDRTHHRRDLVDARPSAPRPRTAHALAKTAERASKARRPGADVPGLCPTQ